ncbi:hypothetical protein HanIR_Chr10g0466721 [Helianthus annuus]|nr:hypothetical protein HanIR_Chr10g0466721 [Helianthus annuus]
MHLLPTFHSKNVFAFMSFETCSTVSLEILENPIISLLPKDSQNYAMNRLHIF